MYLYHATDRKNLDSILKKGLLKDPPIHNWKNMYCDGKVFLAFDANVAEDYASQHSDDIVVLKIPYNYLDEDYFDYDWNNRCEYKFDINSCVYYKDISPEDIGIVEDIENEPIQSLEDFRNTFLYERVLDVFDEQVETNKEYGE